jgi:hypothetical protein
MLLITAIVVLPLAWLYFTRPHEFLEPFSRVNAFGPSLGSLTQKGGWPLVRAILENFWLGVQSFTHLPLMSTWYPTGEPLLSRPLAELFLAGVLLLVFGWRESRNVFLLLWIASFIFVGGFSNDVPSPQRYVAVLPACMLAAAFGVSRLLDIVARFRPAIVRHANALVMLAIVFLSLKSAVDYYTYYAWVTRLYLAESDGMIAQELGWFLETQPEDTQVVFFGYPRMGYYSIPSAQFLVPHIQGLDIVEPWGSSKNPQPNSKHIVFVFLAPNQKEIPKVQSDYPGGTLLEKRSDRNRVLYYYYVYSE